MTKATVFDDIAVAHGEIYALYQIAQTMGTSLGVSDSMAHIASKLTTLVPFSACTLFLYDQATDTLRCRFATGTDFELMQQLTLKSGQGLHGLGGSQPALARERATELRPGSRRDPTCRPRCSPRSSVRWCSRIASSARWRSITRRRASIRRIIAGCSTASASRPRR